MKQTIRKLHDFISRLIIMLEKEIEALKDINNRSSITAHKNITDILNKLVHLIIRLHKIDPNYQSSDGLELEQSDNEIISNFIQKITKETNE